MENGSLDQEWLGLRLRFNLKDELRRLRARTSYDGFEREAPTFEADS